MAPPRLQPVSIPLTAAQALLVQPGDLNYRLGYVGKGTLRSPQICGIMPGMFRSRKATSDATLALPIRDGIAPEVYPVGIKVLHEPAVSTVDVVFVHGLNGNRETTWTARESGEPWPKALLPAKLPTARILTFGYDSQVMDWRGVVSYNRIGDHAWNLLTSLARYRDDDSTRPIIFVCHSLGGLVCEDALVTARQRSEAHLRSILHATRGIAFLGTPHSGSGLATWAERISCVFGMIKQTNSDIVGVLRRDSEVLARIQGGFHTMILDRGKDNLPAIEITCFYEEIPMSVGLIVEKHSAILPGYIPIGIRANHSDMTKFADVNDAGFEAVCGELRRWLKANEAKAAVAERWSPEEYGLRFAQKRQQVSIPAEMNGPGYHPRPRRDDEIIHCHSSMSCVFMKRSWALFISQDSQWRVQCVLVPTEGKRKPVVIKSSLKTAAGSGIRAVLRGESVNIVYVKPKGDEFTLADAYLEFQPPVPWQAMFTAPKTEPPITFPDRWSPGTLERQGIKVATASTDIFLLLDSSMFGKEMVMVYFQRPSGLLEFHSWTLDPNSTSMHSTSRVPADAEGRQLRIWPPGSLQSTSRAPWHVDLFGTSKEKALTIFEWDEQNSSLTLKLLSWETLLPRMSASFWLNVPFSEISWESLTLVQLHSQKQQEDKMDMIFALNSGELRRAQLKFLITQSSIEPTIGATQRLAPAGSVMPGTRLTIASGALYYFSPDGVLTSMPHWSHNEDKTAGESSAVFANGYYLHDFGQGD